MKKTELDIILENIYKDDYVSYQEMKMPNFSDLADKISTRVGNIRGGIKNFFSSFKNDKNELVRQVIGDSDKFDDRFIRFKKLLEALKINVDFQKIKTDMTLHKPAIDAAIKNKNHSEVIKNIKKITNNIEQQVISAESRLSNQKNLYYFLETEAVEDDTEESYEVTEDGFLKTNWKRFMILIVGAVMVGSLIFLAISHFSKEDKKDDAPPQKQKAKTHQVKKQKKDADPDAGIKLLKSKELQERSQFYRVMKEKMKGQDAEKYKELKSKFEKFQNDNIVMMKSLIKKYGLEEEESTSHIYFILDKKVNYEDYKAFQKIVREADDFSNYANSEHMEPILTVKYLIWLAQQ
jgi:hypothetical protein